MADALTQQIAGSGKSPAPGVAGWLSLAAAPVFATMAVLTETSMGDQPNVFCMAAQGSWPISGMVLMYLLMSVFHLSPWLRLISSR